MKKIFFIYFIFFCLNLVFSVEFVNVKGGKFHRYIKQMDCYGDSFTNDIIVDDFKIASTELSIAEYKEFCDTTNKKLPKSMTEIFNDNNLDEYPIYYISFYDAVEYCNWLSEKEGMLPCYKIVNEKIIWNYTANGYRLPTQAEWEYAASCGGKDKKIISDNFEDISIYINSEHYIERTDDLYVAHRIKSNKANKIGLYDILDNVAEWCWDLYNVKYLEIHDGKLLETSRGADEPFEIPYLVSDSDRVVKGGITLEKEYFKLNPIHWIYGLPAENDEHIVGIRLARNAE